MKLYLLSVAGICILLAGAIHAQAPPQKLYFVSAGIPDVPARLYRLSTSGGSIELVRTVAPNPETVLADYDLRKLVIASPVNAPHDFSVVDMSSPETELSASIKYDSSSVLPDYIYLLALPDKHLRVVMPLGQMWKSEPQPARDLAAVRLDVPGAAVETLPLKALEYVRVSGYVGGGEALTTQQVPEVRGNPLHILVSDPTGFDTTIPRPPYLEVSANPVADGYRLFAVNDSIAALLPVVSGSSAVIDVYDKSTHAWHRVAMPFAVSRARAFGPWISAISSESRAGKSSIPRTSINVADLRAMRSSPGKANRQSIELHRFRREIMTLDEPFDRSTDYYPGDLTVFNGHSSKVFTIHTGEGDSEVVLCTDVAVYYRVNDALYRSNFVSGALAPGIRVAQGPELIQAHWAFLGPVSTEH